MGFLLLTNRHGHQNLVSDQTESFFRSYNNKVPETMRYKIQSFESKEAAIEAMTSKPKVKPVAKVQVKNTPKKK